MSLKASMSRADAAAGPDTTSGAVTGWPRCFQGDWAVRPHQIPSPFRGGSSAAAGVSFFAAPSPDGGPQRKSCVDFVRGNLANRVDPATQRIDLHNLALFFRARNSVVLSISALIALSGATQGFALHFWHVSPHRSYARFASTRVAVAEACKSFFAAIVTRGDHPCGGRSRRRRFAQTRPVGRRSPASSMAKALIAARANAPAARPRAKIASPLNTYLTRGPRTVAATSCGITRKRLWMPI